MEACCPKEGGSDITKKEGDILDEVKAPVSEDHPDLNPSILFTFKNKLFEVVEELRVRRAVDQENEEKLKQLINEKHANISKLEDSNAEIQKFECEMKTEKDALKKQYEGKIKLLEEEKVKNETTVTMLNKEIKSLKDEIRELQIGKYTLEKKLNEQDRKMSVQTDARTCNAKQIAEIEEMCKKLKTKMATLSEENERLAKNVVEAVNINKKIMYINNHQNCEISNYTNQISALKAELVSVKIKLDAKPSDQEQVMFAKQQKILKLEQEKQLNEQIIKNLRDHLEKQKLENEKNQASLKDSVQLLQRHVDSISRYQGEIKLVTSQLTDMKEKQAKTESVLQETEKQLSIEKEVMSKGFEKWTEQEELLNGRLKSLQQDYEAISKSYNDLEELNNRWATDNMQLKVKCKKLKDELNKPKTDIGTQIQITTIHNGVQVSWNCSSVYTQTVNLTGNCCTQTGEGDSAVPSMPEMGILSELKILEKRDSSHVDKENERGSSQPLPMTKEVLESDKHESHSEPLPDGEHIHCKRNYKDLGADVKSSHFSRSNVSLQKLVTSSAEKRGFIKAAENGTANLDGLDSPSKKKKKEMDTINDLSKKPESKIQLENNVPENNVPEDSRLQPTSILTDPLKTRKRPTRRVTFAIDGNIDPDNIKPDLDNEIKCNGAVNGAEHSHGVKQQDDNEESLFSDDESEKIDLGSQISRIETFLKNDRLSLKSVNKN